MALIVDNSRMSISVTQTDITCSPVTGSNEICHECVICFLPVTSEEELRKCACSSGKYHKACIIHWLLKYKACCPICMRDGIALDMRIKDFQGNDLNALLIHAVRTERADLVRFLLKFSADPNQRCAKHSLLNYALIQQSYDVAEALLQDSRTKRQKSVFFVFTKGLGEEALNLLLNYGINVNYRDTNGKTVLMYAVQGCRKWDFGSIPAPELTTSINKRIIERLLAKGAKVNAKDAKGQTALMLATHSLELVKLLVSKGANVNSKTLSGETPLSYSASNKEVEDFLISQGAIKKSKKQFLARFFKLLGSKKAKPFKNGMGLARNMQPF